MAKDSPPTKENATKPRPSKTNYKLFQHHIKHATGLVLTWSSQYKVSGSSPTTRVMLERATDHKKKILACLKKNKFL